MTTRQLPLTLDLDPAFGRADFIAAPGNQAALALVEAWPDWPARVLALHGPKGSGKTHLAHVWAALAGAAFLGPDWRPEDAAGRAWVLEDVTAPQDEVRLFHLLNVVAQTDGWLLLTAAAPVARLPVALPDLRSRLAAVPAAALSAPDDELLRAVLAKLFADRQIRIEANLIDWLLPRMERTHDAARAVVAQLDAAALAARRPVTLALARTTLGFGQGALALGEEP